MLDYEGCRFFVAPTMDHVREIEQRGEMKKSGIIFGGGTDELAMIRNVSTIPKISTQLPEIFNSIATSISEISDQTQVSQKRKRKAETINHAKVMQNRRKAESKGENFIRKSANTIITTTTAAQQEPITISNTYFNKMPLMEQWYAQWMSEGKSGELKNVPRIYHNWFTGTDFDSCQSWAQFSKTPIYDTLVKYQNFIKEKLK